jgi:tetratricopeptide (TPR) repeat protein
MKKETGIILFLVGLIIGFVSGMITITAMQSGGVSPAQIAQQAKKELPPITGAVPDSVEADQQAAEKARINEKIKQLKYALEKDPQNLEILVQLGNDYFDTGQYYAAIDSYNKALAINSDLPNVLVDLGIMYRRTERPDLALEQFDKALKIDPRHLYAYSNRGVVHKYDLKEYQKAIDDFKKFIELAPAGSQLVERAKGEIASLEEELKKEKAAEK